MQNRNRRLNRSLSPFTSDHHNSNLNVSPDCFSKFNYKQNGDINIDTHHGPTHTKDFFQSPINTDYTANRKKKQQQFWNLSLSQINLQLDNNMNQIIYMLSKRKNLLAAKKKRVRDDVQAKLIQARNVRNLNQFSYFKDKQFMKVVQFCKNTKTAVTVLTKLTEILPNISDPNQDQKQKSQFFWQRNRQLQNQIDDLLAKLKSTDKNLQKQNIQIQQICKQLDRIEQHLKSFVGSRNNMDNVQRVQPLFDAKKKKYQVLNRKIKTLDFCKDNKIQFIKKIKRVLEELLQIRQRRLKQIANFFGLQNFKDFIDIDFKDQGDFASSFQQLLKIKQKDGYLQIAQKQTFGEIEALEKQQQRIYNQLLKKQSDQAKAYHGFYDIVKQRVKYISILSLFGAQTEQGTIFEIDPKELNKKFKQYKGVIKIFLQQENSLREGLTKTSQTSKTFSNLLSATENEKERRYQLLSLLQTCIRKRGQYEQKKQELRNIAFEQSRNQQQLFQYQDQLQAVLTDGDIDNYKQIGQAIGNCQKQKTRLILLKQKIQKDMDQMDREVITMANKVKQDYQDILCDIVPSDYHYSLKNGEDVKKLRNHLRKMYKRLGILSHQSN